MPGVCKFWLQGYCRNGDSCRFDHPSGRNQPNNRGSNRFGPLDNDRSGQGGRGSNPRRDVATPYSLDAETIRGDLSKEPPQWILSCYGPGRGAPAQLFGGSSREQSFEEMRLRHYELAAQGQSQQAIDEAQKLVGVAAEQMRVALQDVDGAIEFICSAERDHPNRIDICKAGSSGSGSVFANAQGAQGFGKPAGTSFGQPSQPTAGSGPFAKTPASTTGGFGQPSQPSTGGAFARAPGPSTGGFGQPSNPSAGPFGQQSASATGGFGQPSGQPAMGFGQPSAPSTGFGQPSLQPAGGFGQPSAPATGFGQPSTQSAGGFGQPSAPSIAGFGQPSAPSLGGFGQPSIQSTGGFGQTSVSSSGGFGNTSISSGGGFGKPSTTSSGGFGKPLASAVEGFGQPSESPFAKSSQQNSTNPFAKPQGAFAQKPQPTQPGPGGHAPPQRDGAGKLTSWEGKPVSYPGNRGEPCFRRSDGQWERIWFPDGEPVHTMPQEIPLERYDENLEQEYRYLKENHVFRDGVIPQFPPKWEWTSWDF